MIAIEGPAKLNLVLRVLAREASGYHSLETLFCAISLSDELRLARRDSDVRLRVNGVAPTAEEEENLAVRAARRFMTGTADNGGYEMELTKRIPAAAGLGGGSSDAAATLLGLQALRDHPAAPKDLLAWAAELGSDVPFFLCGSPLALAWSRGERLLALPPLPSRPVLVAHPGVAMPTADAFRLLASARAPDHRAPPTVLALHQLESWEAVAGLAVNDFEGSAIERIPRIADGLVAIRRAGAFIAMLAGSGASIFGIFSTPAGRDAAEAPLAALGFTTWRAETLEKMPLPRLDHG